MLIMLQLLIKVVKPLLVTITKAFVDGLNYCRCKGEALSDAERGKLVNLAGLFVLIGKSHCRGCIQIWLVCL